ncbi:hypothetical protein [Catellatospora coxensis]|uniref:Uncharacterized protein n=1 Tax=Catellatospora coxensis TaxID=310354 RepID=A0A8J3KWC1_9ACTN|nr:hypothetical protein [Catellatospora coxensis]GIG08285.1 hypothetical protein Cco03nite_49850 [Catellatospora coxensis]
MNGTVRHQPRVAFDAARVLVGVAAGDAGLFAWYTEQLVALLGPSGRRDLSATRKELTTSSRENTRDVEGGKWRAGFEDLLRTRPEVTESLHQLTLSAQVRLPHAG